LSSDWIEVGIHSNHEISYAGLAGIVIAKPSLLKRDAMDFQEQRQHERKSLDSDALIADLMGRSWAPIQLLDVSVAGLAFMIDEEVAIDDIRMLEFSLPGSPGRICCEVKIMHRLANRSGDPTPQAAYRVGAVFERIDSEDVSMIERFIRQN
jgi:hypothetical protein